MTVSQMYGFSVGTVIGLITPKLMPPHINEGVKDFLGTTQSTLANVIIARTALTTLVSCTATAATIYMMGLNPESITMTSALVASAAMPILEGAFDMRIALRAH